MKLSFQRVAIDPKRTPDEEVMVVLLRHYALSRDISERAALKDFTITLEEDVKILVLFLDLSFHKGAS